MRLTPRAAKDAIASVNDRADGRAYLGAHVRAVPEKGAANAALERLVAGFMGVPPSKVSVTAGTTARLKTVHVAGQADALADLLCKHVKTG